MPATLMIAFDSDVLTSFLNANASLVASVGHDRASFQLFMYSPDLTILPTVTIQAERMRKKDDVKREEHLRWVWYHFPEAQFDHDADHINARAQELLPFHPEHDLEDCRIVAEAERAGVEALATIDRKFKRLQPYTSVRLLTPERTLQHLGIVPGQHPRREPATGHPHCGVTWWRL